jgi:hypothetical protein
MALALFAKRWQKRSNSCKLGVDTAVMPCYNLHIGNTKSKGLNMEKLFTVAGTSNLNGAVKFRFATDLKSRIKVLERNGHTDIDLRELPHPMTKAAAIAFLEAGDAAPAETAATVRESLEADGIDTAAMSDEFLADVAAREMESEGAPAQ